MYSVSADYTTALNAPVKRFRLVGSIGGYSFTEDNIVENSFSITNRVSEGSEIKLGSVYVGQLKATFTGLNIARGAWLGKEITVSEGLQLADESFEDVPLGVYTVAEANHTLEGVEVVAYDNMTKLDKLYQSGQTNGTPYALLGYACTTCGITLGMTQGEVEALTNGTATLYLADGNDIETYRDFVSWIAQTLGAVATINRSGALVLREYKTTSDATIDESHRFVGCSFSDYSVKYTACVVTITEDQVARYANVTPDDGLTYVMGANPFMQLSGGDILQQNVIDAFSDVQLVPFSASMLGGAIYDLCDCLTFSGGIASGAVCGIMAYQYSFNRGYKIEGYGSNPDLANAKSSTDKDITGLIGEMDLTKPRIFAYTNASAITIADGGTARVAYIHAVAKRGTTLVLQLEVNHTASTTETDSTTYVENDLNITGKIYVNGVQEDFAPVEVEQDGKQGYFITHHFVVSEGGAEIWVDLSCAGGSISVSIGDVKMYVLGMGLTEFVMERIEVASMPSHLFPYGVVSYDGLGINGVYNDGSTQDVTDGCTISPAEGTDISGDAESVSFTAEYDDFEVYFDAPVNPLFSFLRETDATILPNYASNNPVVNINGGTYTYCGYFDRISGNTKIYAMCAAEIGLDANNRPVKVRNKYVSTTFDGGSGRVSFVFWENKIIADANNSFTWSGHIQNVAFLDLETMISGQYTPVFHDDPAYNGTVTEFNTPLPGYGGVRYDAVVIDGYLIYPNVLAKATRNGSSVSVNGYAYGKLENDVLHIYLKQGTRYTLYDDNMRFIDGVRFKYDGGTFCVDVFHFDEVNFLTVTRVITQATGSTASSGLLIARKIENSPLFYARMQNPSVNKQYLMYSTDWSYVDDIELPSANIYYDSTQDVYLYFTGDTSLTDYTKTPIMYFSKDLESWKRGGCEIAEVANFLNGQSANIVKSGAFLIGTVNNENGVQVAYSAHIEVNL